MKECLSGHLVGWLYVAARAPLQWMIFLDSYLISFAKPCTSDRRFFCKAYSASVTQELFRSVSRGDCDTEVFRELLWGSGAASGTAFKHKQALLCSSADVRAVVILNGTANAVSEYFNLNIYCPSLFSCDGDTFGLWRFISQR